MVTSRDSRNDLRGSGINSEGFFEESIEVFKFIQIFVLKIVKGLNNRINFSSDLLLEFRVLSQNPKTNTSLVGSSIHTSEEESGELVDNFSFRNDFVISIYFRVFLQSLLLLNIF